MLIRRVGIHEYKGIEVEFPLAAAVVLFGANDSGKSNILEGLISGMDSKQDLRAEPFLMHRDWLVCDPPSVEFDVELDGLDLEGHPDQELFLSWMPLTRGVVWEFWPQGDAEEEEALRVGEEALWAEARAAYARLDEANQRSRAVSELVERVRAIVLEIRDRRLAMFSASERLELKGKNVFASRWFNVGSSGRVYWADTAACESYLAMYYHSEPNQWPKSLLDSLDARVIRLGASQGSFDSLFDRLERLLEGVSRQRGYSMFADDPWLKREGESVTLEPVIGKACDDLSGRANSLAPRFVSESYEIEIVPLLPDEWRAMAGRHVAIRLRPRAQEEDFDLSLSSSGIAVWTACSVSEAIRLKEEEAAEPHGERVRPAVYVIDEPEAHLHPLAQEQAAAWVAERARSGAQVLLATHATPFLDLPLHDVEYLQVARSSERITTVTPITSDIMGAVEESAAALGLPPAALIQLTRGWLIVEGEHDRWVLEAFHGGELREARIRVLALRGASRAKASFAAVDTLASLGLPFFYLLDNVRAAAVKAGRIEKADMTEEEHIAEQVQRRYEAGKDEIVVLGLPYPDVVCALPIEAVRQVASENGGKPALASSWNELRARHEEFLRGETQRNRKTPRDFKAFVLARLGLNHWNADRLVTETLRACEGQPPPPGPLSQLVSQVVAMVDDRPSGL